MVADPDPHDASAFEKSDGSVTAVYARGIDRLFRVNLLEVKGRVSGVLLEEAELFPGQVSDVVRERV